MKALPELWRFTIGREVSSHSMRYKCFAAISTNDVALLIPCPCRCRVLHAVVEFAVEDEMDKWDFEDLAVCVLQLEEPINPRLIGNDFEELPRSAVASAPLKLETVACDPSVHVITVPLLEVGRGQILSLSTGVWMDFDETGAPYSDPTRPSFLIAPWRLGTRPSEYPHFAYYERVSGDIDWDEFRGRRRCAALSVGFECEPIELLPII